MTNTNGNSAHPFEVAVSKKVQEEIKQLAQVAAQSGRKQEFVRAARRIFERLQSDPTTFGERLFRWANLNSVCYVAVVRPIAVRYAVHEQQPVVIPTKFTLLS